MTAERALTALVRTKPAITDLIGVNPMRWYPMTKPQGATLPLITYQRISTVRPPTLRRRSRLARPRIQLTLWAASYSGLETLARVLRESIDGFRGPVNSYTIQSIIFDDENDDRDAMTEEYRRFIDLFVWLPE